VDVGSLLEQAWKGLAALVRPVMPSRPTASALFLRADQCRQDGQYDEAQRLVAEGLALAPENSTGHLLAASLHLAGRDTAAAHSAFRRALELDPYHPRALLGLARIAFEEGEIAGARGHLARALEYHQDFPEAEALLGLLEGWTPPAPGSTGATTGRLDRLAVPPRARDLVLMDEAGATVAAGPGPAREPVLLAHLAQVKHISASALARSDLGPLRRGYVDCDGALTVLRADDGRLVAVTLPAGTAPAEGWRQLDRVWSDVGRQ